uniref:BART domain-containing protein n=1 Tax=Rhizochromulina marina TaxID=1034831 RepID=A0A7S2SRL1_9STRA|mmetsp:Transcript_5351/g.15728  ORF Transcript_5351/g.15728 Transcript_5351/m.15728 type:complete len:207 (+) Transcript_5351:194-814(+)
MDPHPAAHPLITELENFFSSPDFTTRVGDFIGENVHRVQLVAVDQEQPLENFQAFREYQQLVEECIDEFMAAQGTSQEELHDLLKLCKDQGVDSIICLDYMLASTEYASFLALMADFAGMCQWDPPEGAEELGGELEGPGNAPTASQEHTQNRSLSETKSAGELAEGKDDSKDPSLNGKELAVADQKGSPFEDGSRGRLDCKSEGK